MRFVFFEWESLVSADPLEEHTYLPESQEQMATIASFLEAHHGKRGGRPMPRYFLAGADEGEQVEVPEALHKVLVQAVEALRAGKAVTISPTNVKLTTQQAADLLGVSRPTVVRLIEAGEVASERIGNRRKILLTDLLAYREDRRKRQYDAILNTAADLSDEEDPIAVQRRLKQIRKQRAGRRRKSEGV